MRIKKVGVLNGNQMDIELSLAGQLAAILTNNPSGDDAVTIVLPLMIGVAPTHTLVNLDCPFPNGLLEAQLKNPTSLRVNGNTFERGTGKDVGYIAAFMFRNQIFLITAEFQTDSLEEETILLIRKQVFEEDSKISRLRREVEALERLASQVESYKRTAIPEIVKLVVWQRDEGKCVRCGSSENLQFDHIIPVTKGGASSELNIQLLCCNCNLKKSDKIAF